MISRLANYGLLKLVGFLSVAFVAAIFCGCNFKVPKEPTTLVWHINSDPDVLNPILSTTANASVVAGGFIYETMIELDNRTLEYKPHLAESWEISSDHLQFTFRLRKDVQWSDGAVFNADDVIFSYEKIADPKVDAAVMRTSFNDVKNVEKLDDFTVRFTYAKPYFRGFLVCGGMPIVPKHIFDDGTNFNTHKANRAPVGTGPYLFKEWKTKQKIVLIENPNYWGARPKLKKIVFRIIEDSTVPFQELKKGNIDLAEIRAIQWEKSTSSNAFESKFNKAKYFLPNYSFIGWNSKRPQFIDAKVRRAMSMMVRKKEILEKLLFNNAVMIEGDQYYFGEAYDRAVQPHPFDPSVAAQLLSEAGWVDSNGDGVREKDGVKFEFEYIYPSGSQTSAQIATMLREDLKKIGVVLNPRGLEFSALTRALDERSFDAVTLAWAMPLENDPYQLWHSSQIAEGSNFVGFNNPEADKLIEAARVEFDRSKRNEYFRQLQQILHEEQPYTFMFTSATLLAYSKRFTGVEIYRLGVDTKEWGIDTLSH